MLLSLTVLVVVVELDESWPGFESCALGTKMKSPVGHVGPAVAKEEAANNVRFNFLLKLHVPVQSC